MTGRFRILSALLALALILSPLAGCRKNTAEQKSGQGVQSGGASGKASRGILTGIYNAVPLTLPDGFELADMAEIRADEAGEILLLAVRDEERILGDGTVRRIFERRLITCDGKTGEELRSVTLEEPENPDPAQGVDLIPGVTAIGGNEPGDTVASLCGISQNGGWLIRWDAGTGALLSMTDTSELRGWKNQFSPRELTMDGGGNLWLSDGIKVVLTSPELVYVTQFKLNAFDLTVLPGESPDSPGQVWAVTNTQDGRQLVRLDPETGTYADPVPLEDGVGQAAFDPSGERFFYGGSNGIASGRIDGTPGGTPGGEAEADSAPGIYMNFVNSNVTYNATENLREDSVQLKAVVPAEDGKPSFVMTEWSRGSDGRFRLSPVLFVPGPDLDLDTIRAVQIAHWTALPDNILWEIGRFNKAHPDIRVTTLDYSDPADNPTAAAYGDGGEGARRLAMDIVTGIASPDLLMGPVYYGSFAGMNGGAGPLLEAEKHGLAADLAPYFARDGLSLEDDLFGAVRRSFTDGEGRLWGVAPTFSLGFLLSSEKILGEYGERGRWTTEEFLDFVESLPADCALWTEAVREGWLNIGPDLGAFIDRKNGTASFDSPLFLRALRWAESLPTRADWCRPGGEGEAHGRGQMPRYPFLNAGKVALLTGGISTIDSVVKQDISSTGDKSYAMIGYPSDSASTDSAGSRIDSACAFVMLTAAEDPDACWEFLRACLEEPVLSDYSRWGRSMGIPALKSVYDAQMEIQTRRPMVKFLGDCTTVTYSYIEEDLDYVREEAEKKANGQPWILEPYDPAELARMRDWIDAGGLPFTEAVPPEVTAIVQEEVSAWFGGLGSAEDCAKKIQSRASIWLAENQ